MLAAPPFSYLETLDRVDDAIESNAELARTIVQYGLHSFGVVDLADAATGAGGDGRRSRSRPPRLGRPRSWP